jgi:hypothetical protein
VAAEAPRERRGELLGGAIGAAIFGVQLGPAVGALASAVVILMFAFAGTESALVPGGEMRDPARTVPRALGVAMLSITLLYVALQVVAQGVLGTAALAAAKDAPLAAAAARAIGPAGAVIVGAGAARSAVERLRAGDRVTVAAGFAPHLGPLRTLVGGWPRIVRAGRSVAVAADSAEGTFARFSHARHPRSAIGISRDSATLYLVAVEGRRRTSVGMSLDELADAMLSIGAYDALNLDGGGSTALVVADSLVSVPSDTAGERPVGEVIAVTRRTGGRAGPASRVVPATRPPTSCVLSGNRDPDRVPKSR